MSDRRLYHRANFSTATTPASGGKSYDIRGNEYARIPLQLPNNMVDMTRRPRGIEMLLTKLKIPLGAIPAARIAYDSMSVLDFLSPPRTFIRTKGKLFCWPFNPTETGDIQPTTTPTGFIMPTSGNGCIVNLTYPAPSFSAGNRATILNKIVNDGVCTYYSFADLMTSLTQCFSQAFRLVVQYDSTVTDYTEYEIRFVEKDSQLHVQFLCNATFGAPMLRNSHFFRNDGMDRLNIINCWETDIDGAHLTADPSDVYSVGLCVNKHIRDLFPTLPWQVINNDTLGAPYNVSGWTALNDGDPNFYLLRTEKAITTLTNSGILWRSPKYYSSNIVDLMFPDTNLISTIPITSFFITMSGVTISMQTYPICVNPAGEHSAQTSSLPVVEVYYPLWDGIKDLSTDLIISKDAFTNAAPFILGPDALTQRNVQFRVHFAYTDGHIEELSIPANSAVTIQACYSISYY